MLNEGDVIKGRYRITRKLGEGGMGAVFEVYDELLQRRLALKTLRPEINDPSIRSRFLGEARAVAVLQHPNILSIFDIVEEADGLSLLMPLVEGSNVGDLIAKGPVPLDEVARIIRAVAKGLDYVHAHGIVHRDIKPSNILLEPSGGVFLTDFGIAKFQDARARITRSGTLLGTVGYMAPEVVLAREVTYQSDIYSLGATAFEMLSGRAPFEGDSDYNVLNAHVQSEPPLLTDFRPEIPPETARAIGIALSKKPQDRFPSAEAFAESAFPLEFLTNAGPVSSHFKWSRKWLRGLFGSSMKVPAPAVKTRRADDSTSAGSAESQQSEHDSQTSGGATQAFHGPEVQILRADAAIKALPASPVAGAGPGAGRLEDAEGGSRESTVIFRAPVGAGARETIWPPHPPDGSPPGGEDLRPRVSLTFTASADPVFIGKSVPITQLPFVIGRAASADLCITSDAALSRQQCSIDWKEKAYVLTDLGSRNSTWLNGRALSSNAEILLFGSVIRFSNTTALTFVSADASELPDLTGCLVGDRFKLTEYLRGSSKSALYKADDTHLPREVALKILSPTVVTYPGYLEEFNREAEIGAKLRHPHIAKVLDFGPTAIDLGRGSKLQSYYVCMEFMQGGSLAGRIGNGKFMTTAEVFGWLSPIAEALDYIHRNGVVHSGIKSTSVIFDEEGKPYLTDFAIATYPKDNTRRVFLGTPEFMAPEQWDGLEPTQATDQYALAVLAYYALTGVRPYEGQQEPTTRKRNFARGPAPVHQEAQPQGGGVTPALSAVIARGMTVKPEERYSSVRDLALAFQFAMTDSAQTRSAKPEVFLSYRRDVGAAWAALFSKELQRLDISVFVDTERRDNVVRFPAWLEKAIEDCDVFVCLVSANTLESNWVREEIRLAWHFKKPMVPVLQEDFHFPSVSEQMEPHIDNLLTYQGVQLLDRKGIYFDATVTDLAKMIKASWSSGEGKRAAGR